MISKKMEKAINDQINAELYSAYLYLSMAAYFDSTNLSGFSAWMKVQANEEYKHAMKFYGHITDRLGTVTLKAIDGPKTSWKSPLDAFENVFEHEQKVTGLINNLVEIAAQEKDNAAFVLLQWYVNEQVEEEKSADEIVQILKRIKDSSQGLIMLDRELAKRGS
jgi:ferritin